MDKISRLRWVFIITLHSSNKISHHERGNHPITTHVMENQFLVCLTNYSENTVAMVDQLFMILDVLRSIVQLSYCRLVGNYSLLFSCSGNYKSWKSERDFLDFITSYRSDCSLQFHLNESLFSALFYELKLYQSVSKRFVL